MKSSITRHNLFIRLLPAVFCTISAFANGADSTRTSFPTYSFSSQIRYRGELDGRSFNTDAKPLFFNLLRAQFGVKIQTSDYVQAFLQLQHSQNFGEGNEQLWNGSLDGMSKNITFRQAWINWNHALIDDLSLKLGRMSFATNNERIIGALDWHNIGRLYDGAVLNYGRKQNIQFRAFGFVLGNDELLMTSGSPQSAQGLMGADFTLPWQDNLNIYLYYDRKNNQSSNSRPFLGDSAAFRRITIGIFSQNYFKEQNFEYEAEFALQKGNRYPGPGLSEQKIDAFMAAIYAGYRSATIQAGAGFDYYTGNNNSTNDTYERFNHLTFTIHKFYGYMDFFPFTVLPNNGIRTAPPGIQNAGLLSPWMRIIYRPDSPIGLTLAIHNFNSEQQLNSAGSAIGTELDAIMDYKLSAGLAAQLGFSIFLPGQALKAANSTTNGRLGTDPAYWAYSMLTFSL
jgi:hypothetical protein